MADISLTCRRTSENGFSNVIQLEHTAEEESNRECAELLCAIAYQEILAIDFPNEIKETTDILEKLKVSYRKDPFCVSIKINPAQDHNILRSVLRLCGHTSQQFATGSERQITAYLREKNRISKYTDFAANLSCVGQLECYKDRIEFATGLAPKEIQQRLKKLPYTINFKS